MRVGNLPGIRRLPMYLTILRRFLDGGAGMVSAAALAEEAGMVTSLVRKDLEMAGAAGTTGIGYDTEGLIRAIETYLGWDNPHDAFLVGAGALGASLLGYDDLRRNGLNIVAAFDADPKKAGKAIHGTTVLPMEKLVPLARRMHISIGVVAVPPGAAQEVADRLVEGGIGKIWTFGPELLKVPDGVIVQREDLSAGLAVLLLQGTLKK